jgi:hypothetical protein
VSSVQADVNLYRQASAALAKNLEFCRSGPGRAALNQIEGLNMDFRQHLSWMLKMGKVQDTFGRLAVPNYMVRVLRPLSQGLRLDFLLGQIPECFLDVKGLLEQLARSFEADARFGKERDFNARLSRLDSSRTDLPELVENLDGAAGGFLVELSSAWVKTSEPLTSLTSADLSGGAQAFTGQDLSEVARLGEAVGRFRTLLSKILQKWKDYQEKK